MVELISGGAQIAVTNENKMHYLNLLAQYRLASQVRDEVEHFLKGTSSSNWNFVIWIMFRSNQGVVLRFEWTCSWEPFGHIWWKWVGGKPVRISERVNVCYALYTYIKATFGFFHFLQPRTRISVLYMPDHLSTDLSHYHYLNVYNSIYLFEPWSFLFLNFPPTQQISKYTLFLSYGGLE